MKVINRKRSPIIRTFGMAIAFLLVALCFPYNGLLALAQGTSPTNEDYLGEKYTYLTIEGYSSTTSDTVTKGGTYTLRKAYIGGSSNWEIGNVSATNTYLDSASGSVSYVSSTVEVTYNGAVVTTCTDYVSTNTEDEDDDEITEFTASKEGSYTVTYSYTYDINGTEYTNSYDLTVESTVSSASISIPTNGDYVLPSVIDLNYAEESDTYKDVYIPKVEVTDEDGEDVESFSYITDKSSLSSSTKSILVTVNGGVKTATVEAGDSTGQYLRTDENGDLYLAGGLFKDDNYGAGTYTIKYSFYDGNNFITSTTKTFTVYSEEEKYYGSNYALTLELSSDWVETGAETGVASTLPTATGIVNSDNIEDESTEVAYKVEVLFSSNSTSSGWTALDAADGYLIYDEEDTTAEAVKYEDAVLYKDGEHCYLIDPTTFTPLKDGNYTFLYTITDFYGNTKSTSSGVYEFRNVEDETAPTPVLYDASEYKDGDDYVDASDKLATQATANGVIIYAIGATDNVSSAEDCTLTRKIMTDETVTALTIDDYDTYNLIFNFYGETLDGAWNNLLANNYLLRKQVEVYESANSEITTAAQMLTFLKDKNYLIVFDNGNIETMWSFFGTYISSLTGTQFESLASADALKTLLQGTAEEDLEALTSAIGFAYLDVDTTFGATSSQSGVSGMGAGYYYVHYIAEDAAGNSKDVSKQIYITSSLVDDESPEITFSTTLKSSYTSGSTVTFTAPTVSDDTDTNMVVKTYYRFLNGSNVITADDDGTAFDTDEADAYVKDIEADLKAEDTNETYKSYLSKYASYFGTGYIDLTDTSASSYSIDLSQASSATKVQIFVYAYDDAGNVGIYATTIDISSANDKVAPTVKEALSADSETYSQGDTITIPSMTIIDDAVAYISFNVAVTYISSSGTTATITPTGYYGTRNVTGLDGSGTYKVTGGSFVASYAGTYRVSISIKDGGGNIIVSYAYYTVSGRSIVQEPTISTTLDKTQTLELDSYALDDTIEIPAPTVTYSIPNSVTYDVYKADKSTYDADSNTTLAIYGVDEDGKPLNYTTTFGQDGYLKPRDLGVGEYDIVYTVNLYVYSFKTFAYAESGYEEDGQSGYTYKEGGYFTYVDSSTEDSTKITKIYATGENEYSLTINGSVYTMTYVVDEQTLEGTWKLYDASGVETSYGTGNTITTVDENTLEAISEGITLYSLTSDTYTITIQDTTAPKISAYDYPTAVSTDTETITIYGIESTADASGINWSKSYIRVSWQLATGASSYEETKGSKAGEDYEFTLRTSNSEVIDGTYTITYTVYDNAGNYATSDAYTIAVGDNTAPTITVADGFIADSYEIGSTITLDYDKVDFKDASGIDENSISFVVTDSDGEEVEAANTTDSSASYSIDTVGTYTLTITVKDNVGWETTKTIDFEVTSKTTDSTTVYQVVGTILIVVSVVVLAGVIIYFIVSKVKLDKELKK